MARISGVAAGSVIAGALSLYAGIKGYSIPQIAQDVITGRSPAHGNLAAPLTAGTSPNQTSSAGIIRGSASQLQWATALLAMGGWPTTAAAEKSIVAWEQREGGGGANNPLNTTLPMPGATDFNSVGVKNYVSIQQGLQATVETLHGGPYGDILLHLRSGQGFLGITLAGLSTWSGGGYSSVG